MALTKIGTDGIKDDAVTADKVANAINTSIAANTAKDLTALSASNLTSGTVPDARFPATLPAASAANLTAVPAANITGTLPAISAANLTNVPAANITGTLPAISGANLTNLPASGAATNLVINGAMNVAQRDTGSGFTGVDQQEYTIDRFITLHSYGTSTINVINSSQSPDGFSKSYKVDVTAADTSIGSGQFMFIRHKIEAQDLQQLAYGTSSAKSITLSFYVRSNVTGTYAICLQQKDNSSKQVNGTYTINSADTWERKTFTFAGDTSGVINNDTGHGLDILWTLVAGSNRTSGSARPTWTAHADADESYGHTANVLSSTSNDWHLTGVQLEVGDSASDFAHESYAETLRKCQRYYWKIALNTFRRVNGYKRADSNCYWELQCPVPMRTGPSPTILTSGTFTNFNSNFSTTQSGAHVNEWNQSTGWGLLYVSSNWSTTSASIPSWEGYSIEFSSEL